MYKLHFSFLALLFVSFISAQGVYDNCYFGTAGLNFSTGSPTVLTNSQMVAQETAVSISNNYGNLLFYSNGGNSPTNPSITGAVWNANHQIMENGILGDSSGCISSFQGAVAFPEIPDTNQKLNGLFYYIFMRDCIESSISAPYYNSGLTYCKIDMGANNGLGKVVSKNNVVVPFSTGGDLMTNHEPVAVILNSNNTSWWVFSYNSDSLYSIEVGTNGIGNYKTHVKGKGAIIFSPSRNHVMVGSSLYTFNATIGTLTFLLSLPENHYAFSPNGKFLYGISSGIKQYNLQSPDIISSQVTINTGTSADNLYLAPDGKIYLFKTNVNYLPGVINCPNKQGVNCNLSLSSISLNGKKSGDNFTNIPANYLYREDIDCRLSTISEKSIHKASFSIYPNPANNTLTISMPHHKKRIPFCILSIEGKEALSGIIKSSKQEIDLSTVEAGIYFITVLGNRKKIIIY